MHGGKHLQFRYYGERHGESLQSRFLASLGYIMRPSCLSGKQKQNPNLTHPQRTTRHRKMIHVVARYVAQWLNACPESAQTLKFYLWGGYVVISASKQVTVIVNPHPESFSNSLTLFFLTDFHCQETNKHFYRITVNETSHGPIPWNVTVLGSSLLRSFFDQWLINVICLFQTVQTFTWHGWFKMTRNC